MKKSLNVDFSRIKCIKMHFQSMKRIETIRLATLNILVEILLVNNL